MLKSVLSTDKALIVRYHGLECTIIMMRSGVQLYYA